MKNEQASLIPADLMADMLAVTEAIQAGRTVTPEIAGRIRERSEKAQAELLRQYGVREIAVDLVRAIRDEE